jgi:hypothetical protein
MRALGGANVRVVVLNFFEWKTSLKTFLPALLMVEHFPHKQKNYSKLREKPLLVIQLSEVRAAQAVKFKTN